MKRFKEFLIPVIILLIILGLGGLSYFLQYKNLIVKSKAHLFEEGDQLKINFQLTPEDLKKAQDLSNNLGISTDWEKGISLKLDEGTMNILKNYLPTDLDLTLNNKQLNFSNSKLPSLQGEKPYQINIDQPLQRLNEATKSGQLYLSDQLKGLYLSLAKVATINISISGKKISGWILLK